MLLTLSILLFVCLLAILLLGFRLIQDRANLSQMKTQYSLIKDELSKIVEREHAQTIQNLELRNQIEANLAKDFLTGLVSRHIFEDRLNQVLKESHRHHLIFAVLFLNLDGFKIINEALGLDAGDELLKEAAQRLQLTVRRLDTVSRFGNDDFVIILPQLSKPETAAYVAQRLLNTIAQPFRIKDQEIFITASIGIAVYPTDADEVNVLLKNADSALHQAKIKGPSNYQFYRREIHVLSQKELVLSSKLRSQNIYQDLLIYYQPQVNTETKKIFSMEAMLRWKHPDFGLIDLNDFMRLAESSGNIDQIGEWFLRNACQQFHMWKSLGFCVESFSVNVSLQQLKNPHFIYKVSQLLQELNISPGCLILEISEALIDTKSGLSEKTLIMLKEMGVRICLSDFGIGHTSLWQLRSMPLDTLKISSKLIQDMIVNKDTTEIVKMIVALGNTLRLEVVAAGVDTQNQVQILKTMGCVHMQGDIFSCPVLPHEFTMLVEKSILENV